MRKSGWSFAVAAVLLGVAASGARAAPAAAAEASSTAPQAPPTDAAKSTPDLSTAASGDVVITNPQALACQNAAKIGDFNGEGVAQCSLALGRSLLSQQDMAAIYTNRGAVYLQHREFALAKADFDAALKLDAATADAYVDRGAALLGLKQYADAIADIDHGLSLGPDQPEKAYFNRAMADEHLNDLKGAYRDYFKASQLKPDWDAPKRQMVGLNP